MQGLGLFLEEEDSSPSPKETFGCIPVSAGHTAAPVVARKLRIGLSVNTPEYPTIVSIKFGEVQEKSPRNLL